MKVLYYFKIKYKDKISTIGIQLPTAPVFDTYSLKEANDDDIKRSNREQAKNNKNTR